MDAWYVCKMDDLDKIDNQGVDEDPPFVLIGNAGQSRPVHACKKDKPRKTLCGVSRSGWSKSAIPSANFCSKCEKSLLKMGWQVSVEEISKVNP